MKYIRKKSQILSPLIMSFVFATNVNAQTVQTKPRIVMCADRPNESIVYSIDQNKNAKMFPDAQTFHSYGYSFSDVDTIPCEPIFPYKLVGMVENKNGFGFRLNKKKGDPAVFQCAYKNSYFVCDKIANEKEAARLFGSNWSKQIYETNEPAFDMLVWHWKKPVTKYQVSSSK